MGSLRGVWRDSGSSSMGAELRLEAVRILVVVD